MRFCFSCDHISHDWMLQHVLTDKVVLQKWLKAGYMENRTLFPTEAGTPQGGIIYNPTMPHSDFAPNGQRTAWAEVVVAVR